MTPRQTLGRPGPAAAAILRVIQRTCDTQGNVTMLRLAESIANDATLVCLLQAQGWDAAVQEAEDCGLLHDVFAAEMRGRNPCRGGATCGPECLRGQTCMAEKL